MNMKELWLLKNTKVCCDSNQTDGEWLSNTYEWGDLSTTYSTAVTDISGMDKSEFNPNMTESLAHKRLNYHAGIYYIWVTNRRVGGFGGFFAKVIFCI